jgi:AraC-like DNA-binding protein
MMALPFVEAGNVCMVKLEEPVEEPGKEPGVDADRSLHPGYARVLMSLVQARDASALKAFSLEDLVYLDPSDAVARCPLAQWHHMMDTAERVLGSSDLVPDLAVRVQPWHVGLVGFTLMTSRNLEEVGRLLRRFHHLLNDVFVVERKLDGSRFFVRLQPAAGTGSPRLARLSLAVWVQRARWLTGRPNLSFDVSVEGPDTGHQEDYRRLFGGQVRFGEAEHRLWGDSSWLGWPLVSSDAGSHALLQRQASQQLAQLTRQADRFVDHLQAFIHEHLGTGRANLDDLAAEMKMPTRTLQRRLEAEGLNLRMLIDQVRRARAEVWLRESAMPLVDIAAALGFADHASFNRAFKRWTGCSPGAFRRAAAQWRHEVA